MECIKIKVFNLHTDQLSQDQSKLGAPLSQVGQPLWMALSSVAE